MSNNGAAVAAGLARLNQRTVQCALVAIEPATGNIVAPDIVYNTRLDQQWGAFKYDAKDDLGKTTLKVTAAPALVEQMTIALKPAAEALMSKHQSKDDPETNCLPTGVPRQAPYPWRMTQNPDLIVFLFEANIHSSRHAF